MNTSKGNTSSFLDESLNGSTAKARSSTCHQPNNVFKHFYDISKVALCLQCLVAMDELLLRSSHF